MVKFWLKDTFYSGHIAICKWNECKIYENVALDRWLPEGRRITNHKRQWRIGLMDFSVPMWDITIHNSKQDVLLGSNFILLRFMLVIISFLAAKFHVLLYWFGLVSVLSFLGLFFCLFVYYISLLKRKMTSQSTSMQYEVFLFSVMSFHFKETL